MSLLISFLYLCLHIAIICFIAYAILWLLEWFKVTISEGMMKFGKIIVALLIIIAVVVWLTGIYPQLLVGRY